MTDKGNVFFYDPYDHRKVTKGDVDAAFEKADVIVKGAYRPSAIEQAPIEPQGCLVVPESDGRLTVYTCTQAMYFTMGVLAEHLQRAPGSIKLVGGTVGGGFGGKVDSATEPLAAILALKARRPVRWIFTREEEMLCGSVRASWHVEMADALTQGRLDPRPQGADAARRRRLHALLELRRDQALVPPGRRLHRSGAAHAGLRRLVEPRADDRHARLRRDLGVVRDRAADDAQRARARPRSVGVPPQERQPPGRPHAHAQGARGPLHDRHDPGLRRGRRAPAVRDLQRHEERGALGRVAARAPRDQEANAKLGDPQEAAR